MSKIRTFKDSCNAEIKAVVTQKVAVYLITGFLGSGKTTLINFLLNNSSLEKALVLVNEFGEISIDDSLIKKSTDTVVEMKNGCVCCSLNDDLATTLNDLIVKKSKGNLPPFNKLLLETTGLANAGPILDIILNDPLVKFDYRIEKVITTIDGINGITNLNIHAESVEQAAVADQFVISKVDKIDKEKLAELCKRLNKINPRVEIQQAEFGSVDIEQLLSNQPSGELAGLTIPDSTKNSPLDAKIESKALEKADSTSSQQYLGIETQRHDHNIRTFCLTCDEPIEKVKLVEFWQKLGENAGNNLLRIKGIVNLQDHPNTPVILQGVQKIFDDWEFLEEWPDSDRQTRIVFIGWLLDEEHIRNLFTDCQQK